MDRKAYPSDVTDEEWTLAVPYLTLMTEEAPQRKHDLRKLFNGLHYVIRTGCPRRMTPHDLPPWWAIHQQSQRWIEAGSFEALVHDLRELLRVTQGKRAQPTAAILDARTLRSTTGSGQRAGYDGDQKKRGSKVHIAVDTPGHLLALVVTPAKDQDRDQVRQLAIKVQEVTGKNVEITFADQVYTGDTAAQAAAEQGIQLEVVKLPEAKRGFVLLPKRWVVERSFARATKFRRLVSDYERLAQILAGMHFVAFAILMLTKTAPLFGSA